MYQTNRNSFGLSPANQVVGITSVAPGSTGHCIIPLTCDANKVTPGPISPALQVGSNVCGCQGIGDTCSSLYAEQRLWLV